MVCAVRCVGCGVRDGALELQFLRLLVKVLLAPPPIDVASRFFSLSTKRKTKRSHSAACLRIALKHLSEASY